MPEDFSFSRPSTLSCKFLSTGEAFTKKKAVVLKLGYNECFDFMDQCFAIDHSDFISERQAVRTVYRDEGIQEKQDIKGFLKSRGCLLGKNGILYSALLHTLYMFSQHQKSKGVL